MIDRYLMRVDELFKKIAIIDRGMPSLKYVFQDRWHGYGERNYAIHNARLYCANLNNLNEQALLPY